MELTLGRTGGPCPHKIDFSIPCLGNVGRQGGLGQHGRRFGHQTWLPLFLSQDA